MLSSNNGVAITLAFSCAFFLIFNSVSSELSDQAFYFVRAMLSIIICYIGFGYIDIKQGIKGNWRLILLCALSIIDAIFLASFLMSFFFNGLFDPMLYLYWESNFSWRVIYSSIELLLILELSYNGIIYLYSFIHHSDSCMCKLTTTNNEKVNRL